MDFSSLILMERDKETGFITKEIEWQNFLKNKFQKGFILWIIIQRVLDNLMGVVMSSDFLRKGRHAFIMAFSSFDS